MALFSKKPKSLAGLPGVIQTEDEILGYLDEIVRQRGIISIRTKEKNWDCGLYSFDIKSRTLRIEDSVGLIENADKPVHCGFAMDSTWFMFISRLIVRGEKPYLQIPTAIQHKERRKKPRTALGIREGVKVTALQGLGAGMGLTGAGVEISEDSLLMTIERSLMLENERKVPPNTNMLPQGTDLAIVKISNIPGIPSFQVGGKVLRITQSGGWKIAIKLENVNKKIQGAIGSFVKSRFMPYKPTKRSYQRRLEYDQEREKAAAQNQPQVENDNNGTEQLEISSPARNSGNIIFTKDTGTNSMASLSPDAAGIAPKAPPPEAPPPEAPPTQLESSTPQQPIPTEPVLLSIGEELKESLKFLESLNSYRWVHVESPLKIIKNLNENKPVALLSDLNFKRQSMLDYLEKISAMGVLEGVDLVLFSSEKIAPKDLIRCRMLGIKHTFQLPLQSPDELMDVIPLGAK